MTKEFDLLVFIGRFQPFHNEHKRIIDIALEKSRNVLVLVGSSGKARTIRNPFTFEERAQMILDSFDGQLKAYGDGFIQEQLIVQPLYDKTYNDAAWIKQVQSIVRETALDIANGGPGSFRNHGINDIKIGLIGMNKDHTSYYLKLFPQFKSVSIEPGFNINTGSKVIHKESGEVHTVRCLINHGIQGLYVRVGNSDNVLDWKSFKGENLRKAECSSPIRMISSTEIREEYLTTGAIANTIPNSVDNFLNEFKKTETYHDLHCELEFVRDYKKQWEVAPYPVKQVTVDAVVEQSGHILLVKRRSAPGKGLWAIPGGHLDINEKIVDGVIRELREETGLKVPDKVLLGSIENKEVFDDPHRSTIGRVVTHAYHFKLTDDVELPRIKIPKGQHGTEEVEKARWFSIDDIREDMMFDDHFAIVQYFLGV